MAVTYEPIATTTVASSGTTSSIVFSGIPSTYTDLRLILVPTSNAAAEVLVQLNTDSGTGPTTYSATQLAGNGTSATSTNGSNTYRFPNISPEGTNSTKPSIYTMDFMSYTSSTFKTVLFTASEDYNGSGQVSQSVGLWRNTAAINAITLTLSSLRTYNAGARATLYGITKA